MDCKSSRAFTVHRGERLTFSPALIPQSKWVPYWGCLKFHRRVHYLILLSLIPLMLLRLPALSPPTGEHLACYLTLLNHVTVWRDHCGRGFHAHTHSIISCRDTLLLFFFHWNEPERENKRERATSPTLHFLWFFRKTAVQMQPGINVESSRKNVNAFFKLVIWGASAETSDVRVETVFPVNQHH